MLTLTLGDFRGSAGTNRPAHQAHSAPDLAAAQRADGLDVRLKAEIFQRVGSYKIRGPLNKFALMSEEQKKRGVVCSSAGNHAQGVALAARIHGIRAVVCMAENATPAKIAATRATAPRSCCTARSGTKPTKRRRSSSERRASPTSTPSTTRSSSRGRARSASRSPGLAGGRRRHRPDRRRRVDLRRLDGGEEPQPEVRVIGVESSDGPAMKASIEAGQLTTIDCRTIIDGLRVRRVGEINFSVVQRFVDEIVALPDREIFDAMIWIMERCKLVVEGAAAAPVAALLNGRVNLPAGSRVAVVLSGGNVNLDRLRNLTWN